MEKSLQEKSRGKRKNKKGYEEVVLGSVEAQQPSTKQTATAWKYSDRIGSVLRSRGRRSLSGTDLLGRYSVQGDLLLA